VQPQTLASRRRLYLLARVVVARHYNRQLTLAAVAGAVASSPRQVQRAYAQFGGLSFAEDLLSRRMTVAAQLLAEQPAIPVRDVARLVGYHQAAHFAGAFRRRYGLAPARFREQARAYRRAASTSRESGGCEPAADASSVSAPGRSRRMSVPPPGAGTAAMLPPCWSATCRTIARPSPEPGRPRASAPR
jgi:AraC-like DNA-binding protein